MDKKIDLQKSLAQSKLRFTNSNSLIKYTLPFTLFIIGTLFLIGLYYAYNLPFLIVFISIMIICILSIATIFKNEKLFEITVSKPAFEFKKDIETKIDGLGWKIVWANNEYITANEYGKIVAGSQISILFYKKSIFVNVQNLNGFRGYFPFSFGTNKKIRKMIVMMIGQIDT